MRSISLVALGGALGALARYGVAVLVTRRLGAAFPWATLLINVTGCFLIALFLGSRALSEEMRLLIPVGFVGAYTTFSTYEWEIFRLLSAGSVFYACLYVAASNVLGLLAVAAGAALTRPS